jgi:hypothetical protein
MDENELRMGRFMIDNRASIGKGTGFRFFLDNDTI